MLDTLLADRDTHDNVKGLLTTFAHSSKKMLMHGVQLLLVEKQASSLGLPLYPVWFYENVSNDVYEKEMEVRLNELSSKGYTKLAFGDLFLEDIRSYREDQMRPTKLDPIFPLWGKSTRELSREFIDKGYKAKLVCVDGSQLSSEFLGREYDEKLLQDLPDSVDPCGENGEFHTFVYDGPLFQHAISFEEKGQYIQFDHFHYLQLE